MSEDFRAGQEAMMADLGARGITDARVLKAMAVVPRHEFVPENMRQEAYNLRPLLWRL